MPHVRLGVDVHLMTAGEKREAAAILLEAAERLSNIDPLVMLPTVSNEV